MKMNGITNKTSTMETKMNLNKNSRPRMKKILLALLLTAGVLAFTACSKEDNNESGQKITMQAVQFRMAEEGFGTDIEVTRAAAQPSLPVTTELSDCEAETTVENEPAEQSAAATRGVTTPTHYTIRVYKGGVMQGEMKGTFTATSFTPDGGSPTEIQLARNQTYDFVCFNDQVVPVGDRLEVSLANAATARIGRQQITLGTTDQTVSLSSKHVGVRVRTRLTVKKDIPALTAMISSASPIPQTVSYNPADGSYNVKANAAMTAEANSFSASTEAKYTASNYGQNYAYTSTADYHYFLPKTDLAALQVNFTGGTLFRETLSGWLRPTKTSKEADANETYLVKAKMKPTFLYLMSDGSHGTLKDTPFGGVGGTKTPIAVIIDKVGHMAVALRNAYSSNEFWADPHYAYAGYLNTNTHSVDMSHAETALTTDATSGIDETWDANYSTGVVRGDKVKGRNPDFPPFKACVDYGSGISYSGSPTLTWYLPSSSDFRVLYDNLGFGDRSVTITSIIEHYKPQGIAYGWYGNLMNEAFTAVGGSTMGGRYWSSTLFTATNQASGGWMMTTPKSLRWSYFIYHNNVGQARAFVKY